MKIIVNAFCDMNLGDDLFLRILAQRYPQVEFRVLADKEYSRNIGKNFKAYHKTKRLYKTLSALRRRLPGGLKKPVGYFLAFIDRLVFKSGKAAYVQIGGSMYQEKLNDGSVNPYVFSGTHGLPCFVIGASFGPFESEEFVARARDYFRTCRVCFRDRYSYSFFEDLPTAAFAPDVVFTCRNLPAVEERKDKILFSVMDFSQRRELSGFAEAYISKTASAVSEYLRRGFKVTLMSFCRLEGDENAAEQIRELVPAELRGGLSEFFYDGKLDAALAEIASAGYVVALRFHSLIISWLLHKAVFPIVYAQKTRSYLEEAGFEGDFAELSDIGSLTFEQLERNRVENIRFDPREYIKASEGQFAALDEFAEGNR